MRLKPAINCFLPACLFCISISLATFPVLAQPGGTVQVTGLDEEEKKIKEEVLQKIALLNKSILNRDSIQLDILLDSDVNYVHSNGLIQNKAEVIRSVVSGQHDYRKINPRNIQFRLIGQGAVVNMDAEVYLILDGKALELDLQITQIWMKQDNEQWKLVARESTKNE
jgi:CRISPR/Cas system CMR-associated protein Cmr3 (group 5 of RAMP superfamily)